MKSRFPIVELGKHVRQVSQRNRAEADVEVFSVTNSEGFTKSTDYFNKEVFSKDVSNYKIVSPGQFAYNPSRINVGSIDYLRHDKVVLVSPLYIVFEGHKDLNSDYLLRYLRSGWGNSQIRANTEGAVRDSLKFKGLECIKLPLPPLDEQIRIAHLLGKVESLIAKRRRHLQQLDDLLKSVFLDMFGDPVRNEKGWNIGSLSSYGSFKNGLNFGKGENGVTVRYLGVGDFKSKAALDDFDSLGFVELNELPGLDYFLRDGDLLFVRSNGNRELVGRCMAVYPGTERATYSGFCIRYRITDVSLLAIYVAHLFRAAAFRRILFQGGQGANIQNINQQSLSGLPIPVPDKELQNQFAAIVEKVEALKSRYQQSLSDLEDVYGSLSQQAFKGELDLSRVALPADPFKGESAVTVVSMTTTSSSFKLPETDLLLPALQDNAKLSPLLNLWLEAYCRQLGRTAFSVQDFIASVKFRVAELHPERDFDVDICFYDLVKDWVFEALESGYLKQERNQINFAIDTQEAVLGNLIELKVGEAR